MDIQLKEEHKMGLDMIGAGIVNLKNNGATIDECSDLFAFVMMCVYGPAEATAEAEAYVLQAAAEIEGRGQERH